MAVIKELIRKENNGSIRKLAGMAFILFGS